jgi:type II secretory pathway component PulF
MKSYYVTAVDTRGKTVSEVIMAENNLEVVQIIKISRCICWITGKLSQSLIASPSSR